MSQSESPSAGAGGEARPGEEEVRLADGTRILLREVQPSDKPLFERGMALTSAQTRYHRFLQPRTRLLDAELRYLTEVDGVDHYALGAVTRDETGSEEPVAVARFVRIPEHPDRAEMAVTVVDPHQGKGIGHLLFERLAEAARARDVRRFDCYVLAENDRMIGLLRSLTSDVTSHLEGRVLVFEVPLD